MQLLKTSSGGNLPSFEVLSAGAPVSLHQYSAEDRSRPIQMASSVLGRPLNPVEVVSDRIMAAKLSVLLKNTSHPMQHTLTALITSPLVTGRCTLEDETSEPFLLSCCQTLQTGDHMDRLGTEIKVQHCCYASKRWENISYIHKYKLHFFYHI